MKEIKAEAAKSRGAKLQRYGVSKKHSDEQEDRKLFKKMYAEEEAKEPADDGDTPKRAMGGRIDGGHAPSRLDRGSRKSTKSSKGNGKTNVNIIIAGKHDGAGGAMPPGGIEPPMPPMPPPDAGGPPGMPPDGPPPGLPMRKRGGRVHMTAGSGSSLGRQERQKKQGTGL